ncbi:MAG: Dehydroquinase class, partial [Verrucomicrobiota bacterium]
EFRHKSVTASACEGVITGLGFEGYLLAVDFLVVKAAAKPAGRKARR